VCQCELDNSNRRLLTSNSNKDESVTETVTDSSRPIGENFFGAAMSNEEKN